MGVDGATPSADAADIAICGEPGEWRDRLSVGIEYQAAAMTSAQMAEPFGMWSSLSAPTMTRELMVSAGVGRVAVFYGCEMWSRDR